MPTWTHLTQDVTPAWSELTNLLAEVDDTDEVYSPEDLAEELQEADFAAERDSWAVWEDDRLVAFGQLRVSSLLTHAEGYARASIDGGVHPDMRGRGIGTELLARIQPRAIDLARERHPGAPIQLRANGGKAGSSAEELLTANGFEPVRYFTDMARPLPGEPVTADDARVHPYTADLSEAVRVAHNDAFATHWGSTPQTPQKWAEFVTGRSFRPETSRVALDDDGAVTAYVLTGQWVDRELYVNLVGTVQRARGQGLARATLLATIAAAAASGDYDLIELGVDTAHPSGADALYTSVGFAPLRTTTAFAKLVD